MELDKSTLENLIREVVREELSKANITNTADSRQIDPSGVIGLNPDDFPLDKFPFPIESDRVWLKDLFTLEESPRLACGIMELEDATFEWTLTYDEVDYIIDGTLDIIIDGRTVRVKKGEIILIPKNTKIKFSTPDKVRFMYVCYPANWSEQ